MQIFTMKVSKKRIIAFVLLVALVISAVIMAIPNKDNVSAASVIKGIKTDQDRTAYITSLGYEINPEPRETKEVVIPKTFDDVYNTYNECQKECGFDLEKYQGKDVTLYTYNVTNYPNQPDTLIDLLIYKNKIIGGAVYSAAADGFMHGLKSAQS